MSDPITTLTGAQAARAEAARETAGSLNAASMDVEHLSAFTGASRRSTTSRSRSIPVQ